MAAIDDPSSRRFYHGTKADLKPGDLIAPGYNSNFGKRKKAAYVYLTATLNAATWGAELSLGEGPGRIYVVEPTGPIEDDPQSDGQEIPGQSDEIIPLSGSASGHRRSNGLAGALPRRAQDHEGQP
jgi:hypothetical protein